jgi:hypothetical protein
MSRQQALSQWIDTVSTQLPHLSRPHNGLLALIVLAMIALLRSFNLHLPLSLLKNLPLKEPRQGSTHAPPLSLPTLLAKRRLGGCGGLDALGMSSPQPDHR